MTTGCQALWIQHRMGIDEHREERVKNLGSLINIKLSPNTAVPRVTPAASRASNPPLSCWWKPDLLLDSNCQMRLTSRGRQMRPWQTQQGWKVGTQRMIVVQLSLTKDFYILWKAKVDTGAALIIRLPYYFILFYMKREVGHICGSDDEVSWLFVFVFYFIWKLDRAATLMMRLAVCFYFIVFYNFFLSIFYLPSLIFLFVYMFLFYIKRWGHSYSSDDEVSCLFFILFFFSFNCLFY